MNSSRSEQTVCFVQEFFQFYTKAYIWVSFGMIGLNLRKVQESECSGG